MIVDVDTFKLVGAATLLLPAIFFVGLAKVLYTRPHSRFIEVMVIVAFVGGLCGYLSGKLTPLLAMAFFVPLYQLLVFRVSHAMFVHRFGRDPQTAAFNFSPGILVDRLFNVLFLLVAVLAPMFTIAYIFRA